MTRKAIIKSIRRQGYNYTQIAPKLGVSHQRVSQIVLGGATLSRGLGVTIPKKPRKDRARHCLRCKAIIGLRKNYCDPCLILHQRRLRKINYHKNPQRKEYLAIKRKEWVARNPEKAKASVLKAVKKYYLKNREKMLVYSRQQYQKRKAKKLGITVSN